MTLVPLLDSADTVAAVYPENAVNKVNVTGVPEGNPPAPTLIVTAVVLTKVAERFTSLLIKLT